MKKNVGDMTLNELAELCHKHYACKNENGKWCPLYDTPISCTDCVPTEKINVEIEVDDND